MPVATLQAHVLRHEPHDALLGVQSLAGAAPQGDALPLAGVQVPDAPLPEVGGQALVVLQLRAAVLRGFLSPVAVAEEMLIALRHAL